MASSIHDNREFEDGQAVKISSARSDIGGRSGQVVKLYAEHGGNLFYLVKVDQGSEHVVFEGDLDAAAGFQIDTRTHDEPVGFGGAVRVVRWYWRLQDEDGTVLATSRRDYRLKQEAEAAVTAVRELVCNLPN